MAEKSENIHETVEPACDLAPPANECSEILPSDGAFEPSWQSSFGLENPRTVQKHGNISRKRKRTYRRTRDNTENDKRSDYYEVSDDYQGRHGDDEGNNSFMSKELATSDASAKNNSTTPEAKYQRHRRDNDGGEKNHTSRTAEKHRKRRKRHAFKKNQALNYQSNSSGTIKLPFGIMHQLMDMLQKALEHTCYDWTIACGPSTLTQNGLTHHKHGEMQHGLWCKFIKAKYLLPEQKDVYLDLSQNLDDLFANAHTIRHSAVHRERDVSIAVIMVRISKAIELLTALKDFERADYVKSLLKSVERFKEYVVHNDEFQQLPIADEEFRKGQLKDFAGYFDLVVGFMRRENELPTQYLMLDV